MQQHEMLLRQVDAAVRAGDIKSAAALAERALALGIEHPGLLNLAAHDCVERGQLERAVTLLTRARTLAPGDVHVLNSLGIALKRMGRLAEAEEAFDAAVTTDPAYANAHFNKGAALESRGALDDAAASYERAVTLEPGFGDALGRLSYLAAMRGDYDRALGYGDRTVREGAGIAVPAINLAQFAVLRGQHDEAVRLARIGIERAPADPTAILMLARAQVAARQGEDAIRTLDPLLNTPQPGDIHALAMSLVGQVAELAGDDKAAFAAFTDSKAELKRNYAHSYATPTGTVQADRVGRTLRYFADAPASGWAAKKNGAAAGPVAGHVFLVGFPRSGTTLLENALAAHPGIATIEEEESFTEMMTNFFVPADGWVRLAASSEPALNRYRDGYWRACRAAAPALDGKVFVDKMPLNTVLLPFVAKLFPTAKILFALRDPRDVVLSCLKQQFALSAAMYEFCSLEDSARLYDWVMQLREIYREKLALDWLDSRYEDLVADYEGAMRRIFAFLDVAWDDAVRDVTANARSRVIRTPSASQVARGLYDGSGKWRRNRDEMQPVLPLLAPWVAKFGYLAD